MEKSVKSPRDSSLSWYARNRDRLQERKRTQQERKFKDLEEGTDFVRCAICGFPSTELTSHVTRVHKLSARDYVLEHPLSAQKLRDATRARLAENNPWKGHGGKYSPFSEKFVGKTSVEEAVKKSEFTKRRRASSNTDWRKYLEEAAGDEARAREILSERQRTFSLEKLVAKHGEEEGRRRWADRQEKWLKNYRKTNYSKVSQELFNAIMKKYPSSDVYFATWDRQDMTTYTNKELRIRTSSGKTLLPDFVDVKKMRIIEFDGDYWHSSATANPTRERVREEALTKDGYVVFRVKESDFKRDPERTIAACLNFLTS